MCEFVPAYQHVRMEQHCLKAACKPMEGSISVHSSTCCYWQHSAVPLHHNIQEITACVLACILTTTLLPDVHPLPKPWGREDLKPVILPFPPKENYCSAEAGTNCSLSHPSSRSEHQAAPQAAASPRSARSQVQHDGGSPLPTDLWTWDTGLKYCCFLLGVIKSTRAVCDRGLPRDGGFGSPLQFLGCFCVKMHSSGAKRIRWQRIFGQKSSIVTV